MTLELYDTTLRDGAQGVGISFSVSDKLRIADHLDDLGVGVIEGGWPGANPTDTEFFARMRSQRLRRATLAAFGATRRPGVAAADDLQLRALLDSGAPIVTIVAKSWDIQVHEVLRTSADENLRMIEETVAWLVEHGRRVVLDAEHFFDGYVSNPEYALRCLDAAAAAGAERLVLCDTNGGTLPGTVGEVVATVVAAHGGVVGIHCHDDTGCAVAATLAAVEAGAVQVQACVNGYGERTGNANLCTLLPTLQLKLGHRLVSEAQLATLTQTARDVAEIANLAPPRTAPYVGATAFTHKGGQHVDATRKLASAYLHVDPGRVGNATQAVVSAQSGAANVLERAAALGLDLGGDAELVRRVTARVKALEHRGLSFEGADASLEVLIDAERGGGPPFELVEYVTLVQQGAGGEARCEATVKVRVGEETVHTAASGNGPVNALDAALRKALAPCFPETAATQLHDYKVRVLDGRDGTAAAVRVLVETGDHHERWSTVGCSTNIIEASWLALGDAFACCILRSRRRPAAAAG
ncbi:MAG: citramalate synthase [Candidatus Dormibacteria bacterium]